MSTNMKQLRAFYDADSCVLITFDASENSYSWREANRDTSFEDVKIEQTKAAASLVNLPGELAVFYQNTAKFRFKSLCL